MTTPWQAGGATRSSDPHAARKRAEMAQQRAPIQAEMRRGSGREKDRGDKVEVAPDLVINAKEAPGRGLLLRYVVPSEKAKP